MIDYLVDLIGAAPAGLEFLQYIFAFVLVCIGLFIVYKIISLFFGKFI